MDFLRTTDVQKPQQPTSDPQYQDVTYHWPAVGSPLRGVLCGGSDIASFRASWHLLVVSAPADTPCDLLHPNIILTAKACYLNRPQCRQNLMLSYSAIEIYDDHVDAIQKRLNKIEL